MRMGWKHLLFATIFSSRGWSGRPAQPPSTRRMLARAHKHGRADPNAESAASGTRQAKQRARQGSGVMRRKADLKPKATSARGKERVGHPGRSRRKEGDKNKRRRSIYGRP